MDPLLKKMNYKDESKILYLNVPDELTDMFMGFEETSGSKTNAKDIDIVEFAVIFILDKQDIEEAIMGVKDKLTNDAKLWICYPKKSSKKYKSNVNRDTGWEALGNIGYEPVRQVSVNDDFSALRFRNVDKIKTITRSKKMAMTDKAKARTTNSRAD